MKPETEPKKTIAELSVDTQLVIKRLKKCAVGESVSYKELSDMIGSNVQGKARSHLQSARNNVLRDDRMVFECVENVGVKRMSDGEIVETAPTYAMNRIRNTAKRCVRKLSCAEYDKLSRDEQVRFNASASLMGALHQLSKTSALQIVAPKVTELREKLPLAKTLELFSR